jgi:hypothetical protein
MLQPTANSSIEFPPQSNPRTFWKRSGSGTSSTWCGRHCGGAGSNPICWQEGLERVLTPLCGYFEADRLAKSWARNEAAGRKEVKQVLASAGKSMDAAIAQTLALKIGDIERIDRLVMAAEARRDATLREIERHRATLGQALRRETEQVEEGEFEEVDAPKLAANLS